MSDPAYSPRAARPCVGHQPARSTRTSVGNEIPPDSCARNNHVPHRINPIATAANLSQLNFMDTSYPPKNKAAGTEAPAAFGGVEGATSENELQRQLDLPGSLRSAETSEVRVIRRIWES